MPSIEFFRGPLISERPQPRRHVIVCQFMPALRAKLVGSPYRAEAIPAARREPVVALRAEVEIVLHMR